MNRSIVIDARNEVSLLLDGPSLVVQMSGSAQKRFPTRILNQVIVVGDKLEGLPAVIKCASQQINIFFITENGDLRARFLGMHAQVVCWNEWFDQCRWDQTWMCQYEETIKQLWICLAKEFSLFGGFRNQLNKRCYEKVATNLNRRWGKSRFRNSRHWVQGFVDVLATNTMTEIGIQVSHPFVDNVYKDVTEIILLRALIDCHQDRKMPPPDDPRTVGMFYQKHVLEWRAFLIRFFLALEFRFSQMESRGKF